MNLSGNLVFGAVLALAVLTKQSDGGAAKANKNKNLQRETISVIKNCSRENQDAEVYPNATLVLEKSFINGTHLMSKSENVILSGISTAKKLLFKNPNAAKQVLHQAFENARVQLYNFGIPTFQSLGEALGMSNERAKQGLTVATKSIQMAEFLAQGYLDAAENLVSQSRGMDTSDKAAKVLLAAAQLAVKAGYSGGFNNIQNSIQEADKALRYARESSIQTQDGYKGCRSAEKYPEIIYAVKEVKEAAYEALKRGTNAEIEKMLREFFICALCGYVNILDEGIEAVQNISSIAEIEPMTARMMYLTAAGTFRSKIRDLCARVYLVVGDVAIRSGNQSRLEIEEAIMSLIQVEVYIALGIKIAADVVVIGTRNEGSGTLLGLDTSIKIGIYTEIVFIQAIVKCATLVFSVL